MAVRLKAKDVAQAIRDAKGVISEAARILDCSRRAVYDKINKHTTVEQAFKQARETTIDEAENKLLQFVQNPEDDDGRFCGRREQLTATKYLLSTQGKPRGYSKRREITGADGDAIQINLIPASDENG